MNDGTPMAAVPGGAAPDAAAASAGIKIRLFGRTDVGRIREHNEDNFLVADLSQNARGLMENIRSHAVGPRGTLLAVCDGMGGAAAGEVASKLAVDIIFEQMSADGPPKNREDLARRLVRAVEVAGLRIFSEAKADRNRRGMGTTATAAALIDEYLFLAQVGDSRAYLLRGEQLQLVTRDQSLVNQLIEAGQLTEEEAENFEHSNIILQALGTADSVQVDLTYVKVKKGDTILLCSDGLSGMVRGEEIRQALLANPEPIDVCKVLTDKANEAGGHDNITVIVAKFEEAPVSLPTDDPPKYSKYVFQSEDSSFMTAEQIVASGGAAPPSAHPASEAPRTQQGGQAGGKLARTAVGLNAAELLAQMRSDQTPTPVTGAATPIVAAAAPATAPQGGPIKVSTEAELASAGIPTGGMSPWIILAAIVALGLFGVGFWALFAKP